MLSGKMISIFISFLVNLLIVNYVLKLEKITCECSEDWRRDYIKYYSLITIVGIVVFTIVYVGNVTYSSQLFQFLSTVFSIFGFVNVYALFTYSQNIVINKCVCSKSWERTFIYYYSMVLIVLYLLMISSIFFVVLFRGDVNKYNLKKLRELKKLNKLNK